MAMRILYRRPKLYPKQKQAIFNPARIVVIEASTKAGKTSGCLVWLFEQALQGRPGWVYWWVAPVSAQARIAYRRLLLAVPPRLIDSNGTELRVDLLPVGTSIFFKSGDNPGSLFGEDVHAAVIDEATLCKEEVWHAVRSTLTATQGPVRIIGNVRGRRNWAYQLARRAEAGEPGMAYAKLTAYDAVMAGVLSQEEIESARQQLPEAVFRELYLAEPSDDQGNPFGIGAIRRCIAPLSDRPPAVWGIDLAKSVDWTVCIGLDASGAVCRFERWQAPWRETEDRILALVGEGAAWVDSTGVGDPVVETLQRRGRGIFYGIKFTRETKQKMMEGLAIAIQQERIHFPNGPIVNELEMFEYQYTPTGVRYAAPAGLHDDCVCALALAWLGLSRPVGVEYAPRIL